MSKQFKPMKTVNEAMSFEDVTYPKLISVKFDGVYALNLASKLLGRSLKAMKNVWVTDLLSKDKFTGICGEIMNTSLDPDAPEELKINRQDLCRNTTSFTGAIKKEDWDFVIAVFDFVGDGSEEYCKKPYNQRMADLGQLFLDMDNCQFITKHEFAGIVYQEFMADGIQFIVPEPKIVEDAIDAEYIYNLAIDEGHEGIILREIEGIYKFGRATKKSQEMIRFKPSDDSEIIITHLEPMFENNNEAKINELGHTERSSHKENKVQLEMVGALVGYDINTGEEVRIGAGKLTHAERSEVWLGRGEYIGRLAKYRFMATGIKTKPRHPRFISWRNVEDLDQTVIDFASEKRIFLKE